MDDTKRLRPSGVELCLSTQSLPVPHTHKPFSHVHLQTWTFLDVYQDVTEKRVRMQTPDAFGSDISRLLACQLYWYKACVISDYAQFYQYENSCEITRWVSCVLLPLFSSTCYPGSTIIQTEWSLVDSENSSEVVCLLLCASSEKGHQSVCVKMVAHTEASMDVSHRYCLCV